MSAATSRAIDTPANANNAHFNDEDRRHMARALELAERGLYTTDPNPRVGCVIVRDHVVLGEGWHERAGGPHAEVAAINNAGATDVRGAIAYVTLEPCSHHGRTPPCADLLIEKGVSRVVAAIRDSDARVDGQGYDKLRGAGIDVRTGLMADEAAELNVGYFSRQTRGRPWVRLKLAMSLDGRTAMASGESQWITGPDARADVQRWRARSSAILTGVGTVLADNPRMTARVDAEVNEPLLVIADSDTRTPVDARLFERAGGVLIACTHRAVPSAQLDERAEMLALPGDRRERIAGLLAELGQREVNEVHVESGPVLAGELLGAGLVDELLLYVAPSALGHEARPLFELPGLERMDQRLEFEWHDVQRVGRDMRLRLRPKG